MTGKYLSCEQEVTLLTPTEDRLHGRKRRLPTHVGLSRRSTRQPIPNQWHRIQRQRPSVVHFVAITEPHGRRPGACRFLMWAQGPVSSRATRAHWWPSRGARREARGAESLPRHAGAAVRCRRRCVSSLPPASHVVDSWRGVACCRRATVLQATAKVMAPRASTSWNFHALSDTQVALGVTFDTMPSSFAQRRRSVAVGGRPQEAPRSGGGERCGCPAPQAPTPTDRLTTAARRQHRLTKGRNPPHPPPPCHKTLFCAVQGRRRRIRLRTCTAERGGRYITWPIGAGRRALAPVFFHCANIFDLCYSHLHENDADNAVPPRHLVARQSFTHRLQDVAHRQLGAAPRHHRIPPV